MTIRVALAQLPFPSSLDDAVTRATRAIADSAAAGAALVAFPENYLPGYRGVDSAATPPSPDGLEASWTEVARVAASSRVAVVMGTERVVEGRHRASALVITSEGVIAGFQDKVQVDPSEEGLYAPGHGRRVFTAAGFTFGIVICHEGWRYPETVRWAVRHGAQVVFHPHFHDAGDAGVFHPHAVRCRAAENTAYFATINYAIPGAPTTSAVADPEGRVIASQPADEAGLLVADLDLELATGRLAARFKPAGTE